MQPIQRREWMFPLLLAVFFSAVGTLPYWYAYRVAGEGEVFMGFVGRGTPGANSYFAFARQVAEGGGARVSNLYNPHAPSQSYFHAEWWLMGQAARLSGASLIACFHVGRIASVFAFLFAVYYLCAVFLRGVAARRGALALIAFGAGFGWIIAAANAAAGTRLAVPLDAQGVTLFGYLMNKPHFIRAGAFAALQYAWMIRGDSTGRLRYFLLAGLAASGHSLIRPYHIPESFLVLGLYFLARSLEKPDGPGPVLGRVGAAAVGHAPVVIWQVWVFYRNPLGLGAMDAWTPSFLLSQVLWLGLPFGAVLIHLAVSVVRRRPWRPHFPVPVLWLLSAMLLLHCHPYFRWGTESYFAWVFVPPLLFVRYTWPEIGGHRAAARRYLAAAVIGCLVLPSNVRNYAKFFTTLHRPEAPWQYYLPTETQEAIAWIAARAPEESVVLASHDTSQFIPRLANLRVVTGQDVLTPEYPAVNMHIERFFQTPSDDAFKQWFCRSQRVAYVLMGPFERALPYFEPPRSAWLRVVYERGDTVVYAVMD